MSIGASIVGPRDSIVIYALGGEVQHFRSSFPGCRLPPEAAIAGFRHSDNNAYLRYDPLNISLAKIHKSTIYPA